MPRTKSGYASRRRWKVGDARAALRALAASGLSVGAFADREGLDRERLYRWRRRLGGSVGAAGPSGSRGQPTSPATRSAQAVALKPPELIEVQRPRPPEPVEVVLASGLILRVAETIEPATLARLVAALDRRC